MKAVRAEIGYSERTEKRPYFYANAHEKDFVPLKPAEVAMAGLATASSSWTAGA